MTISLKAAADGLSGTLQVSGVDAPYSIYSNASLGSYSMEEV